MQTTISVQNLKKHFGLVRAVDDISFEIQKGEIFGFLGPNGAGKTTTIRCMMDFIRPDSGKIFMLGLNSFEHSVELKKKIGFLSADPGLYTYWRGIDHIKFVEKIRGKSQIVEELIQKLDFDPKMKVKNLSTGNKQKLALILALMNKPEILILDEPTAGLDPILQNEIYKILEQFEKDGCTIFMSSHNLAEVEKICHRVGIIKAGKLVAVENISSLQHKRMHYVSVQFDKPISADVFKMKDVKIISKANNHLIFNVKGDVRPILTKILTFDIADIEISHATLEEIFLEFYERK